MLKKQFRYVMSKPQRGAVLILLFLIICVQSYRLFFKTITTATVDTRESLRYQKKLDALRKAESDSIPKNYLYNPNYLTDFRAYDLGLPLEAVDRLKRYRAQNKVIYSIQAFQEVTQITDSLLFIISPSLKFPKSLSNTLEKKTVVKKRDLNTAQAEDLMKVSGIGSVLSKRIVKYRTYLSGFSTPNQCYEVYGLDSLIVKRLFAYFEIQSDPMITKLDINKASFQELEKVPYLTPEEARKIISYRTQNKRISVGVLSELFVNSPNRLERIILYLY